MPHNQPSRPRQSHSDLPLPRQTATDTRTDPLISALRVSAATAGMPGASAESRHSVPPLASLSLASTSSSATTSNTTSRGVPALTTTNARRRAAAAPGSSSCPTRQPGATFSSIPSAQRQQQRHRPTQRGRGLRAWTLPLAAAAVGFHAARAAARVLAPAARSLQHRARALAGARALLPSLLPKRIGGGGTSPPGVPGGRKPALVWFRNDLRLHDHEPLAAACQGATSVLPVYVFDPREYGKSPNGFDKTGPYRARFILEALSDLRARLRDAGSDLVVRIGKPEDVLPQLARAVGAGGVYCYGEVTAEEVRMEAAVARALDKAGAALKVMWGGTLFHVEDLPFQLPSMPPHYSEFRRAVRSLTVRAPVEVPSQVKALPAASVSPGELPSLQQLGFDAATLQRCANDKSAAGGGLRGGESEAMRRLTDFISHFTHPGSTNTSSSSSSGGCSKQTGAAAEAPNFCCKISPWLALGCLSPRQLYEQLQQKLAGQQKQIREAGQGSDTDMQWLLYELLWRDFFRFVTKKYAVTGVGQRGTAQAAPAAATAVMAMA